MQLTYLIRPNLGISFQIPLYFLGLIKETSFVSSFSDRESVRPCASGRPRRCVRPAPLPVCSRTWGVEYKTTMYSRQLKANDKQWPGRSLLGRSNYYCNWLFIEIQRSILVTNVNHEH